MQISKVGSNTNPPGRKKGTVKTGGRVAGTPNKTTALLKDAILQAASAAGGKGGLVGYLTAQAISCPPAFLSLLGKVLPTQLTGDDGGGPVQHQVLHSMDWSVVPAEYRDTMRGMLEQVAGPDKAATDSE